MFGEGAVWNFPKDISVCHSVTIKQRGDKERRVWLEVADAA